MGCQTAQADQTKNDRVLNLRVLKKTFIYVGRY